MNAEAAELARKLAHRLSWLLDRHSLGTNFDRQALEDMTLLEVQGSAEEGRYTFVVDGIERHAFTVIVEEF